MFILLHVPNAVKRIDMRIIAVSDEIERERIIDDSIMSYTCPHCGEVQTFLKHPLTLYGS